MITLVSRGPGDFTTYDEPALDDSAEDKLFFNACQMLLARGYTDSAGFLATLGFHLFRADYYDAWTPPFVLRADVSLTQYEYLKSRSDSEGDITFSPIADIFTELGLNVEYVVVHLDLALPPTNWRDDLASNVAVLGSNQALFNYRNSSKVAFQGLNFRSKTEVKVFQALVSRGVLVLPLPVAVLGSPNQYREPDFLVCYRGKWGILEVQGDKWHPPLTAARDHERRRQLTSLGVRVCEFFDAKRCWEATEDVINEFFAALEQS